MKTTVTTNHPLAKKQAQLHNKLRFSNLRFAHFRNQFPHFSTLFSNNQPSDHPTNHPTKATYRSSLPELKNHRNAVEGSAHTLFSNNQQTNRPTIQQKLPIEAPFRSLKIQNHNVWREKKRRTMGPDFVQMLL